MSRSTREGVASVEAFRRFYRDASSVVYRYLARATLGDRATAEDLTQETFAAVMMAARAEHADALTMPWAMGIARHKLVDHYRRVEREQRRLQRSWNATVRVASGAEGDEGGEVVEVLRRLAPEHRMVLVLKYYDELTAEQVAATIGRSVDATNSLLSRARAAFARTDEELRR